MSWNVDGSVASLAIADMREYQFGGQGAWPRMRAARAGEKPEESL
jgi:hypothetical protein